MFNATFNNISTISWRSVVLVEETGVPEENHRPVVSRQNFLYRVHLALMEFELITLVMIGTDWIGSYKSNYHTITTTTAPIIFINSGSWECILRFLFIRHFARLHI